MRSTARPVAPRIGGRSVARRQVLPLVSCFTLLVAAGRFVSPDRHETRIARGRYLANGIARCMWCHAPLDDGDPAVPRQDLLGGGDILDPEAPVVAPNITPDPETGIGGWSDEEVVRAIRQGVGRNGRRLRSEHPYTYYSVMTDEDLNAIFDYLRTVRPVQHRISNTDAPTFCPVRGRRHGRGELNVGPSSPGGEPSLH